MIKLSDDQVAILGRPNFMCSLVAKVLIARGVYAHGPNKSEYEQAVCIHWCCDLFSLHGENWREVAQKTLKEWEAENSQGGE